jgi:hypothetical protein
MKKVIALSFLVLGATNVLGQDVRSVSVLTFGADPQGVADSTAAIQKAINAVQASGGAVLFPPGNYKTSSTLARPANVTISGAGPGITVINATCNCAIITSTGTRSNVLNNGGVRDITLKGTWGANHVNTRSIGISESWTNRSIHQNVGIHGTYYGMYGLALWQVKWDNIQVNGAGTDQNYIGFYLDQLPTTFPIGTSNAVQAVNCVAQDVAYAGFRLLNPNGSKFVNDEAENGQYGWFIGDTASGMYPIEFASFANDLADTSGYGWVVQQGSNNSPVTYMHFVNIWGSNNSKVGFYCDGCFSINVSNGQFGNNAQGGIELHQSTYNIIANTELQHNNRDSRNGIGDIWISGGGYNRITGNYSDMATNASVSVLESDGSNNNDFTDNTIKQGATLIGANSTIHNSRGFAPANVVMTAGASPWTPKPLNFDCLYVVTSTGGLSALTTNGISLQTSVNAAFFLRAGKTFTATWATTAPAFTCVPQN